MRTWVVDDRAEGSCRHLPPNERCRSHNLERCADAILLTFVEIPLGLRHAVGDMRETDHRPPGRHAEGIECSGFHLDSQCAVSPRGLNRDFSLAIGRVRRSCRTTMNDDVTVSGRRTLHVGKQRLVWCFGEGGRRQIVIARPFIPKRPIDQYEVRRRAVIGDPPRRSHADKQLAARCEQLLRDQDGERSSDCAADNSNSSKSLKVERQELCVVTRPSFVEMTPIGLLEMADNVPVWIEHAYVGHRHKRETLLPPSLSQQRFRSEYRSRPVIFTGENRPPDAGLRVGVFSWLVRCLLCHAAASTGRPAAFHSGKPSSSLRIL